VINILFAVAVLLTLISPASAIESSTPPQGAAQAIEPSTPLQGAAQTIEPSTSLQGAAQATEHETAKPADKTGHKLKVALALGGGGTRGFAHIGVLRVFKREGIPIDMIAGTSMGAIIGGMYCAGLSPDAIEEKCLKKSFAHAYYTVPIPVRVAVIPIFILPHLFGYHPYDGLYVGNKFANYMNDSLPATRRDIEELKIPYCAVASNLLDGKAYSLTTGNLGRAIQASSAVPELRRPVAIDDKLFVDGGIEANLPVKQAKEMGADLVIAIDVDEKFDARRRDFRKILSVSHRVINMILTKVDDEQVKVADIVVQPDVNGIHLLSNKTADGIKAIKAGEAAAEAALPEIRRRIQAATMAAN
jgi:NTE family protein